MGCNKIKPLNGIQSGSPMVVKLGQQYHVGERSTVILHTYINRYMQGLQTKQSQKTRWAWITAQVVSKRLGGIMGCNKIKSLHGIQSGSPMVVKLGQQYHVGEKSTVILHTYINRYMQGLQTKQSQETR